MRKRRMRDILGTPGERRPSFGRPEWVGVPPRVRTFSRPNLEGSSAVPRPPRPATASRGTRPGPHLEMEAGFEPACTVLRTAASPLGHSIEPNHPPPTGCSGSTRVGLPHRIVRPLGGAPPAPPPGGAPPPVPQPGIPSRTRVPARASRRTDTGPTPRRTGAFSGQPNVARSCGAAHCSAVGPAGESGNRRARFSACTARSVVARNSGRVYRSRAYPHRFG